MENPVCTAQKAISSPCVCQHAAVRPRRQKRAHFVSHPGHSHQGALRLSFVGLVFLPFSFQRTPGLKGQRSGSYPLPSSLRASQYGERGRRRVPFKGHLSRPGYRMSHQGRAVTAVTRSGSLKTKVLNARHRTCARQSCIFGKWGLTSALVGTIMLAAG